MPKKTATAVKAKASTKKARKGTATQRTKRKETAGRKTSRKGTATKKSAAKKSAAKKSAAKKSATKKSAAKKSLAKKSATKRTAGRRPTSAAGGSGSKAPKLVHATLRELEPRLRTLPSRDILAPSIPVERLVAEGVELATVAWRDLNKLTTAGLDRSIVIDLGLRAQALSEAQAELVAARSQGRSSEEEDLIAEATELRSEALAAGRLALRRDPIAQSKLDDIMEGEGLDDLLQDLQDLAGILRGYARDFARVGLKPTELANWSETLRLRLSKHIAERRAGDAATTAAKDLRDRAATLLADAVSITRLTGAYVFRKDPRRLLLYRSGYNAELRARAARRKNDDPTPTPNDPPATPKDPSTDGK